MPLSTTNALSASEMMPLFWLVMRQWLSRAAEHVNRWETDAVARALQLLPRSPASAVTVLTDIARGGLLWNDPASDAAEQAR